MPAPTSAAGGAEGGPPRTELQELQLKAGQTTDERARRFRFAQDSRQRDNLLRDLQVAGAGEEKLRGDRIYRGKWGGDVEDVGRIARAMVFEVVFYPALAAHGGDDSGGVLRFERIKQWVKRTVSRRASGVGSLLTREGKGGEGGQHEPYACDS
ncbi:hypothetical protein ALC62_15933 [Cyphomyrmex costatus]|uniref:Uncharacterized protein n=1 Tax=Cyphomyrmex costatus TaxID=456900 RepID=A0A195BZ20_9HYME|nr:hypothetical protein ALC62_15933 [Cyphomyrmex costatus]